MGWLGELLTFHVGEQQRLQRAASAKGYGLNPVEYSQPYPAAAITNNSAVVIPPEPKEKLWARILSWFLGLVLLLLLLAGGCYAWRLLPRAAAAPPAQPPAATAPANPGEDMVLEESTDGGKTWHEMQRQKVK